MVDREAVREWLVASCAVQGVPVQVTDASVVAQIGVLLRGRDAAGSPRQGATAGPVPHSLQVGTIRAGSTSRRPPPDPSPIVA